MQGVDLEQMEMELDLSSLVSDLGGKCRLVDNMPKSTFAFWDVFGSKLSNTEENSRLPKKSQSR
jgi:hypothetical protein